MSSWCLFLYGYDHYSDRLRNDSTSNFSPRSRVERASAAALLGSKEQCIVGPNLTSTARVINTLLQLVWHRALPLRMITVLLAHIVTLFFGCFMAPHTNAGGDVLATSIGNVLDDFFFRMAGKLSTLVLVRSHISDEGAAMLAKGAAVSPTLKYLDLSGGYNISPGDPWTMTKKKYYRHCDTP